MPTGETGFERVEIEWGNRGASGCIRGKRWSNALTSCWPVGRDITCVSEQPSRETTPPFLERTNRSYRTHSGAIDNCCSSVLYIYNHFNCKFKATLVVEVESRVKWDEHACPNAYEQQ